MSNGEEDSDCGEDDEIWEEEGGYLVISADKVLLTFSRGVTHTFHNKSKSQSHSSSSGKRLLAPAKTFSSLFLALSSGAAMVI